MPGGRPRKPAVLRIAEGKRGHRPIPAEPKVDDSMPPRPGWLVPTAKRKWDELAHRLHSAGLLKSVDQDALATYCANFAMWRDAMRFCEQHGTTCPTTNSAGAVVTMTRPEFIVAQKCLDQMQKLMRSFGLTPQARAGIGATGKDEPKDPFATAMGA